MDQIKLKGIHEPSLLTLLLLVSYPSVGAVLFTPALPSIAEYFLISNGMAQLTITLFLIGYAFGQLPYGPISNKIGRKPTLYIGICLSILGSLLCAASESLDLFGLILAARIFTALGASVGLMMTFTIVSDYYEPTAARQKLAFVILAFAIAPNAAVTLGGFLTQYIGWQSTFYFEALYGIFLIFLCMKLPETNRELSKEPLNLNFVIESYFKNCRNPKLFLCGLIMGCCTAFVYIYAAKAPFLAIHELNISPSLYGLLNLLPAAAMILGSYLSFRTAHHISPHRSILYGLSFLMLPGTIAMVIAFGSDSFNLWTLFVPYCVMNVGITLAYINCPAIGTSHAKNKANGSAILAFLNISVCVIMVFVLELIDSSAPMIMPILFAALLLMLYPLYIALEHLIRKDA